LEFSFGHTAAATDAVEKSLQLGPRNAQAHAVHGFVLAAANHLDDALAAFEQAIALDPMLANGWLGRGLCRIRQGHAEAGRADLQMAAMVEPNRALLRSYLGKAFSNAGQDARAAKELALAKKLDPNDPTAWLYSALLDFQEHRVNEAVDQLEQSQMLNTNRQVYRSRLLLDEDAAVRSASLARIYQQAGMTNVSVREAARAVTYDYANYSAHLFLANSYDALRDPTRFNLRYETAWFNELLLANLLAPVGAGAFSQNISQQEYARLFEVNRLGLISDTSWRSDGQVRELASQFGTIDNFSYSLDLDDQHNDETGSRGRPNNGLDRIEWYSQLKYQLSPADTLFLLTKYQDYHSGDNFQYYDWRGNVSTNFTFDETQTPIIVGGYHHEWSPGVHTLLLAGHLEFEQHVRDKSVPELRLWKHLDGSVFYVTDYPFDIDYDNDFEAYTAELNQIFQTDKQLLCFGGRFQSGQVEATAVLKDPLDCFVQTNCYLMPAASANDKDDFQRASAYAYYTLEPLRNLFLTAGLSYDEVRYPVNFRNPPIFSGETSKNLLGPKAALVYEAADWITLRGIYTRSLGGVTLDQSYRLEPTQLAGFIDTFRSVIPESAPGVGSVSAPTFETGGGAVDLKFKTRTYLGLQFEWLSSEVDREIGVFDFVNSSYPILPSSTSQRLDFEEYRPGLSVNQLLGDYWSGGVSYNFIRSEFRRRLLDVPVSVFPAADQTFRSDLHQVGAYLVFNHPTGFFARAEANWYAQDNIERVHGAPSIDLPSDEFAQVNLNAGWRFPRQRGDLTFGVLNVGGGDYHLNPLNSYPELPHERVYAVRLRLSF
jgi:tetratricopeptide (TPR) repeat protein